jgi:hypothetical protein
MSGGLLMNQAQNSFHHALILAIMRYPRSRAK